MKRYALLILCIMLVALAGTVYAQDATDETPPPAVVPDITGLGVAEAATMLNAAGYRLGEQTGEEWSEASGQEANTIVTQSIEPGTEAEPGTAVDITVLRTTNVLLIYDDNDITLVNQTGSTLNLAGLAFTSSNTRFNANRWGAALSPGDCGQAWSVSRGTPKDVPECQESMLWLTTNDPAEHFWTSRNADATFSVVQNGVERTTCDNAVQAGVIVNCAFYLASEAEAEVTEYIYLLYTTQSMTIYNNTTDRWMPLTDVQLAGSNGVTVPAVPPLDFFDNQAAVGDVYQLAPSQCVTYTSANAEGDPPLEEDCQEINRVSLDTDGPFAWDVGFEVIGTTGLPAATCPPAQENSLTLCIVPR